MTVIESNTPPLARAAEPIHNPTRSRDPWKLREYEFDASLCSDGQDTIDKLKVRWDFDGDGKYDTDYAPPQKVQYPYPQYGSYTVLLEVVDTGGEKSTASLTLKTPKPKRILPHNHTDRTITARDCTSSACHTRNKKHELVGDCLQCHTW